jgi:hypothetical protein
MNQISRQSLTLAARPRTFFRITVGLYVLLLVVGAAIALLLVYERQRISTAGGWGYLMGIFAFAVAAFFACGASVVCTAVSLWRGEAHRRLTIALLIVSALVVWRLRYVPWALVQPLLPHP